MSRTDPGHLPKTLGILDVAEIFSRQSVQDGSRDRGSLRAYLRSFRRMSAGAIRIPSGLPAVEIRAVRSASSPATTRRLGAFRGRAVHDWSRTSRGGTARSVVVCRRRSRLPAKLRLKPTRRNGSASPGADLLACGPRKRGTATSSSARIETCFIRNGTGLRSILRPPCGPIP